MPGLLEAFPGLYNDAIDADRECSNIILVPSEAVLKAFIKALKEFGAGKMCFASNVPLTLMKVALAKFDVVPEELSEHEN